MVQQTPPTSSLSTARGTTAVPRRKPLHNGEHSAHSARVRSRRTTQTAPELQGLPKTFSFKQRLETFLPTGKADVIFTGIKEVSGEQKLAIQRGLIAVIVAVTALVILGNIMVFSATSVISIRDADLSSAQVATYAVAFRHGLFTVVGVTIGVLLARFPFHLYYRFAFPILLLGLVLQGLVLPFGKDVNGNKNWLALTSSIQIQPSEFLKLAAIVWMAAILAKFSVNDRRTVIKWILPVTGMLLATSLVVYPGDMGTGLIFALVTAGLMWLGGVRKFYFLGAAAAVALLVGVVAGTSSSRIVRITEFFHNFTTMPDIHTPTQADHALFAFGTGGIFGVGLGASKEKWRDLREAHTDFIFAIIGEELGMLGALAVVGIFLLLAWGILQIVLYHPSRFAKLFVSGAGLWLVGQAFLNMAVVSGLLPVFGVPLPFISQGGSAIMAGLFTVGVIVSAAYAVPGVRSEIKIRANIIHRTKTLVRRKGNDAS